VDVSTVVGTEERKMDKEPDQGLHWHVTERQVGEFRHVFQFPIDTIDMSAMTASMTHS
jgi:hypothetical protein